MAIHAYDETYLSNAQNILGHAVDFAVVTLGLPAGLVGDALSVSNAAGQFASGNPRYVAGMNGCEFARIVLSETATPFTDREDAMYLDKSPEYWAGWALAFFQWYTSYSFIEILSAVSLEDIIQMYPVFHEMDIEHFVERMSELLKESYPNTRLKTRRINCGFTQARLAADSGIALRQIQLFEQRQRDINNASAITLFKLSKSLNCSMEDLIELDAIVMRREFKHKTFEERLAEYNGKINACDFDWGNPKGKELL